MAMAAAPVESCQSLPNRSPGGHIGSVLYTCKRLRRMRRRFKHFWPKSLSRQRSFQAEELNRVAIVEELLAAGVPPDLLDETPDWTVTFYASYYNRVDSL